MALQSHPIDIIGLDPSMTALGVAHLRAYPGTDDVELVRWTTLSPRPRSLTGERAAYSLADALDAWLSGHSYSWAFREQCPPPAPGRTRGVMSRQFLDGMLSRVLAARVPGLETNGLLPSSWRKTLGIKTSGLHGPQLKARVVEHAVARWDVEFGTVDAAEAALVGLAGWVEIREEFPYS